MDKKIYDDVINVFNGGKKFEGWLFINFKKLFVGLVCIIVYNIKKWGI